MKATTFLAKLDTAWRFKRLVRHRALCHLTQPGNRRYYEALFQAVLSA